MGRSLERETAQQVLFLANTKENERGKEATSRHDDGHTSTYYSSTYSSVSSSRKARRHDASSCLVNCLPGFRRYTHLCPLCKSLIGEGEPLHPLKHILLIIFVSVLVLGIIGWWLATKIITRY